MWILRDTFNHGTFAMSCSLSCAPFVPAWALFCTASQLVLIVKHGWWDSQRLQEGSQAGDKNGCDAVTGTAGLADDDLTCVGQ